MKNRISRWVLVALACAVAPLAARAAQVNVLPDGRAPLDALVYGEWNLSGWDCALPCALSPSYQFTTYGPTPLQVTDFQCIGDRFEVWDNGVLIGTTSLPGTFDNCATDLDTPDEGWADDRYSKGTFVLPAGDHDIQLVVLPGPFEDGTAAIRIEAPITQEIPTLSVGMLALLALALGGAAYLALRRRARPAA